MQSRQHILEDGVQSITIISENDKLSQRHPSASNCRDVDEVECQSINTSFELSLHTKAFIDGEAKKFWEAPINLISFLKTNKKMHIYFYFFGPMVKKLFRKMKFVSK